MKYKTFRNLVFAGLVTAGAGLGGYLYYEDELGPQVQWEATAPPAQNPSQAADFQAISAGEKPLGAGTEPNSLGGAEAALANSSGQASANTPSGNSLRSVDQAILAKVASPASAEKIKDAVPGPIKVNLYHDDKSGYFNRLKIDLDRDEKWDEKWTLAAGKVLKRQLAPADDEVYSEEYVLEGQTWVKVR